MKKLLLFVFILAYFKGHAQETNTPPVNAGFGKGISFSAEEGQYQFKISGYLQPSLLVQKADNVSRELYFRTKRTYVNFYANALKERVSFFLQADFSAGSPLLDAYATYHFTPKWGLSVGQRRTFTNNREMTFNEDVLQFTERGSVSTNFTGNGREFGAFLEGKIGQGFVVEPKLAVTSGDGPNSFGANSTDVDMGGLKYGGRLDVYPLGEFSEGNRGFTADFVHEEKPKILLGVAGSFNQGASGAKGESHGDFMLYNASKAQKLPDYRKLAADILLKYKGVSVLLEWVSASASNLQGVYTDTSGLNSSVLKPGQISQFLVLGKAFNVQAGYTLKKGYSIDARWEQVRPEFTDQTASILQKAQVQTVGASRYFSQHRLKLQLMGSRIQYQNNVKTLRAELMFQVVL